MMVSFPSYNSLENPIGIETMVGETLILTNEGVTTHQKTRQGLKLSIEEAHNLISVAVTTHQKTRQGLKLFATIYNYTSSEVTTHQKTRQGLKLIYIMYPKTDTTRYNSLENPIGIETIAGVCKSKNSSACYNSLETRQD